MPNLRQHQVISIILLLFGVLFATIALVNQTYSITILEYLSNFLWIVVPLMLLRPLQLQSILGIFTSVYYYFKGSTGEKRALDDIPPFDGNPYVDAEKLHSVHIQLDNLNLQPFGAFVTDYGPNDGMNMLVWLYADESQTLFAEICANKNGIYAVEIRSEYTDGFLLGTLYNVPLDIESQRFHVRSFENLTEALDYHQYQANYQTAKHGQPIRFAHLQAYIGTKEKDIAEKRAIAWDGGIAHLRAGRWTVLMMIICFVTSFLMARPVLATGAALLIAGIAFWIEDFFIPRQPVAQMMEQRKKQKALQH